MKYTPESTTNEPIKCELSSKQPKWLNRKNWKSPLTGQTKHVASLKTSPSMKDAYTKAAIFLVQSKQVKAVTSVKTPSPTSDTSSTPSPTQQYNDKPVQTGKVSQVHMQQVENKFAQARERIKIEREKLQKQLYY